MAKEKTVKEAQKPVAEATEAPVAAPSNGSAQANTPAVKKRPEGISPGRIVHFHRTENTQTGQKMKCFPAMILGEADAASNFKPEDAAVDMKVFTKHGDEVKNGIMYSEKPAVNHWSFPAKV